MIDIDSKFIGLAGKTLLIILIITVFVSALIFYYREHWQKEWQGTERYGFTDFGVQLGEKSGIQYVLWIGDVVTTLDVLDLAQKPNTVIQPIYIPDPINSSARTEYELQITRTLRTVINTKYPQSQILPIISITKERPDDDAFNREYDMGADNGASDALTRENILRRWAKYYKLNLALPSSTRTTNQGTLGNTQTSNLQNKKQTKNKPNQYKNPIKKKTSNARILAETWNCRFPIGSNNVPCGLCKKCEKINSL
jgi:hypothetical protein